MGAYAETAWQRRSEVVGLILDPTINAAFLLDMFWLMLTELIGRLISFLLCFLLLRQNDASFLRLQIFQQVQAILWYHQCHHGSTHCQSVLDKDQQDIVVY